jgi:hypothetical protein
MVRFSSLLVGFACASALGAAPAKKKKAPPPPPPPPPVTAPTPKVREALSDTTLTLLASAESAQTFGASDSGGLRPDPSKAIASDFVRGAPGATLDSTQLDALRSVLYDEKSFRFGQDVSRCRFVPNLSVQLRAGIDTLETLISFSCNQVLFVMGKPGGRWIPQGTYDVKPARAKLLEFAKATLPTDPVLRGLK